jgi:hypothetical protein
MDRDWNGAYTMDGQDGQDIRTLCHYIQDGNAMQRNEALAFGARGLGFGCQAFWWHGMEWIGLHIHHIIYTAWHF